MPTDCNVNQKSEPIWVLLIVPYVPILFFRLPKIKEYVDKNDPGAMIIPFSGAFEAKLIELSDEERKAYIEETKCTRYVQFIFTLLFPFRTVGI